MKKLFFGLLLCLVLSMNCFAKEYRYTILKPKIYNDIYGKQFETDSWLAYTPKFEHTDLKDLIIFYFKDYLATVAYFLDKEDRMKIIRVIDKYLEWNNQAIQKKVTLEKTIDEIKLNSAFMIGDEWYFRFAKEASVSFSFFSQNINRHQLVLEFGRLRSVSNEFINHNPEALYFDYKEAIVLQNALKEENIKKFLQDISKKKQIEDEFK